MLHAWQEKTEQILIKNRKFIKFRKKYIDAEDQKWFKIWIFNISPQKNKWNKAVKCVIQYDVPQLEKNKSFD